MSLTIESFAAACRHVLKTQANPAGVVEVAKLLSTALKDAAFVDLCVGDQTPERHVLYEDPELGFCIVAHRYTGAKTAPPHDHENTWAIYGQARGATTMFDYEVIEPATLAQPGKARVKRSYSLTPGVAHAYQIGDLHSPARTGPTQLIRIEGKNLAGVKRMAYDIVS